MRGHIRKRGEGYQIIVELGRDPITGKRKQKAIGGFKRKPDAEKALAKLINEIESGQYFETKDMTVEEYLNTWLDNVKLIIKPKTQQFYENITKNVLIPELGKVHLAKLKPLHIQSLLNNTLETGKLSTTTVRHYYNVLNIALNHAVKWQLIQINPCAAVEPPKKANVEMQVLNQEQVEKILSYTRQSDYKTMYIPLLLALTTGLRRGEILGLKWEDFDWDNHTIQVKRSLQYIKGKFNITDTKTNAGQRSVSLLPSVIPILKLHQKEQEWNQRTFGDEYVNNSDEIVKEGDKPKKQVYVCTWPDGRLILPDYVTHTLKKILKKCELPNIRFHDLRHTHATLLLKEGIHAKVVSERLGHSKVSITLDIYSHMLPNMQKEAVEKLEKSLFKKAK